MKVSYQGRLRKVKQWPTTIDDFRRFVSRKFTENLDEFS
jgi:hypothetical protein